MEKTKFSIIVPAFNAERWINECFESLINQTDNNLEIVVVDDGSTDSTYKLITEFKSSSQIPIKIFHQENSGQIASRLKGIEMADSDYCLFVDSDDTLQLNALEILDKILSKSNVDMVIFNGFKWDGKDKKTLFWPEYKEKLWLSGEEGVHEIRNEVIRSKRFNNICFKAIKTKLLKSTASYSNVGYVRKEEDLLMQLPYFDKIDSVIYAPYELYNYRDNLQSITNRYNSNQFKGCCFVSNELKKYAVKWEVKDYLQYCNTRFLQEIIVCLKQIGNAYPNHKDRNIYFDEIRNNPYFLETLDSKKYSLSVKQKLLLKAVSKKAYSLVNKVL